MDHRLRLRDLLVERSLFTGHFTLSSGARSSYYVDSRQTTMSAAGQYLVGQLGFQVLRAQYPDVRWVGGLTLGADPVAYAVAHRSWLEEDPIDAFAVRKKTKSHGTGRRIEGGLPTGVSVVAVEDTLTSGASVLDAVAALEEHGVEVRAVFAVIDRGAGGAEAIREAGYPLITLFTAEELLEVSRRGNVD